MAVTFRSYMDQTLGYFDRPDVGVPESPVGSSASWRGIDLGGADAWSSDLTDDEVAELVAIGWRLGPTPDALGELTRDDVDAPALRSRVDAVRTDLRTGRGFTVERSPRHLLRLWLTLD